MVKNNTIDTGTCLLHIVYDLYMYNSQHVCIFAYPPVCIVQHILIL